MSEALASAEDAVGPWREEAVMAMIADTLVDTEAKDGETLG
jgi:hypothetical protein